MKQCYIFPVVIAVVAIVVYARILPHEHVLDDEALIPHQSALHDPFDIATIFGGRYWGDLRQQDTLYRPLTIWTLAWNNWVNTQLGLPGPHPVVYRVTSVLLHAGVCVLVFVFARRLGGGIHAGLWAGLLFAVLPIHTEAVACAVNRSEMLALGFGLGFLILFQSCRLLAALCLFGALLSKESAILFVPVAVWYLLTVQKKSERFSFWYGVYIAVLLVWWTLRTSAIGDGLQAVVFLDNPLVVTSVGDRLLTALRIQWHYLFLQVVPMDLSSDYSYAQIPIVQSVWNLNIWLFAGVLIGGGWIAYRMRKTHPLIPFLYGAYVILFGLTSNLFFPIGTIMGERLAYAPSLALCILGGWGVTHFSENKMWWLGGTLVVIYAGVAIHRLSVWQEPATFYPAQVAFAPNSAKAHYAVAHEVYQPAGELDRAIQHYERAVEIFPKYPDAWNNLGVAKKDRGNIAEAIAAYEQALIWHDKYVPARVNLGQAFQNLGAFGKAQEVYVQALEIDSTHAIAGNNLAILYAQAGQIEMARLLFERVLRHHPDYESARKNHQLLLDNHP